MPLGTRPKALARCLSGSSGFMRISGTARGFAFAGDYLGFKIVCSEREAASGGSFLFEKFNHFSLDHVILHRPVLSAIQRPFPVTVEDIHCRKADDVQLLLPQLRRLVEPIVGE